MNHDHDHDLDAVLPPEVRARLAGLDTVPAGKAEAALQLYPFGVRAVLETAGLVVHRDGGWVFTEAGWAAIRGAAQAAGSGQV